MSNRWVAVLLAIVCAGSSTARAQTIYADRFGLVTGPCLITSGAGDPTNTVNGNRCDTYVRTDTGDIYTKQTSGFTSTGWGIIPRLSVANTWTANQTIANASPALLLTATGAGANLKSWAVGVTGTALTLSTLNDALGTLITPLSIDRAGNASILANAAIGGNATIGGTAGITGAVTLGSTIGTATYASQITGWQINQTGGADFRYLYADELRAKLFTADAESVLAGSMRVTKSYSTLAFAFTCPAAGQANAALWVYDASTYGGAPVFQAGDAVVIHVLTRATFGPFTITDCVGTVAGYADGVGSGRPGTQYWNFTRGTGADGGAMTANTVVPVNQLVQDMGPSGSGYVELSAVDGANGSNAPYLQTNTWTTSPTAANTATRCRFGNLNGITGSANEFGMFCGTFQSPYAYARLSNVGLLLRNLPISLWDVTGNAEVFRIDPNLSLAMGNPIPASYGGANSGIWMGRDSADGFYKLRIGNPVGNRLTWNGSILAIVGEGSGITNINGGNIQAGTIQASQLNVTPNGAALNNDPYCLATSAWAEQSNPGHQAISTRVTDGIVGNYSMRSQIGFPSTIQEVKQTPVDGAHKTYRLHAWVRAGGGGNGGFILGVNAYNADGTGVGGVFATSVPAPLATTWTEYQGTLPFPATVTMAVPIVYLNSNGTAGWMEAQDIRLEEVLPSTLIKDGAITTAKIQAGAITATQIAANTITVANLNATGFSANLILNSTFEGTTAAASLAGWSQDPAVAGGSFVSSCCGTHGAGTLAFNPPAGSGVIADYLAVPVSAGTPYRVALDVFSPAALASGFNVSAFESTASTMPTTVRASTVGLGPGEVARTSYTSLCNNCGTPAGWQHLEWTYTPPGGVYWVSLAISDFGTATQHIDGVEMQAQIGPGYIRANSITADRLVANSITSAQIAAGTITAGNIAAGTITSTQIAANTITGGNIAGRTITAGALVANTITSNEIGVRAIVAGNIATGTLTANEIASATITGDRIAAGTINANNIQSGSITADRLSVTSLSAISANLGSITAGSLNAVTVTSSTINSPTINAGCTTINANGIALNPGQSNNCNWYKWTNGAGLYHDGGAWMGVSGASFRVDTPGGGSFLIDSNFNLNANSTINLNGYVNVAAGRTLTVSNLSGSGNRLVCTNNNGQLYTSAANGSC